MSFPRSRTHEPDYGATAAAESARLQALRGLACLLLVAFHVIGSKATSGMKVPDGSMLRHFADLFLHLRMPLFAFLSGFVYEYRPVEPGGAAHFARKKALRLFVPMVVAATVYYAFTLAVPDAQGQVELARLWTIYVYPYVHFWFLQAMIVVFAVVAALERAGALRTLAGYGTVVLAALVLHWLQPLPPHQLFSLDQAIYLLPLFLLGLGANRFRDAFRRPGIIWGCTAIFAATMLAHALSVYAHTWTVQERGTLLGTTISASGVLALLYWFPSVPLLARIGTYSFMIYLYHPLAAGGARKALQMAGIDTSTLVFVCGVAAGLAGPIVIEWLLRRRPLARQVVLGQR
jgi:surface polysaccharide O-acyltransferase-like enzyme